MRTVYINLPIRDIATTRAFWNELGFSFRPEYTDENALCLVIEENIFAMLVTEPLFREFINDEIADAQTTTEVLICLTARNRADVDTTVATAIAAGGKAWKPTSAANAMYAGSFQDPDGHVWELMAQDPG